VICHACKEHIGVRREMAYAGESPSAWLFHCRYCGSRRAVTKEKIGGTVGAGDRRDDGRRSATGKGF
jgi:hypothetical protein